MICRFQNEINVSHSANMYRLAGEGVSNFNQKLQLRNKLLLVNGRKKFQAFKRLIAIFVTISLKFAITETSSNRPFTLFESNITHSNRFSHF